MFREALVCKLNKEITKVGPQKEHNILYPKSFMKRNGSLTTQPASRQRECLVFSTCKKSAKKVLS